MYWESLEAKPIHLNTPEKQALKSLLAPTVPTTYASRVNYQIGLIKEVDTWKWDGGEAETSFNWLPGKPECMGRPKDR